MLFGSCVSRDAIDSGIVAGTIQLDHIFSRSSIASLVGTPCVDEAMISRIKSNFQRKVVRADMDKSFLSVLSDLKDDDVDILLIDLMEERFSLIEMLDGQIITLSDEFKEHANPQMKGRHVESGSQMYYHLWHLGWERIKEILIEKNWLSKVRILEVFMSNKINNGEQFIAGDGAEFYLQNNLLSAHYRFLRKELPESCFIQYPPELLIADANHKWGLAPMHYVSEMWDYSMDALFSSITRPVS